MLKVIDLKGNLYPAQAQVNRKQIVNGEQTMSLSFSHSEMNMDFLPDLSFNWLTNFDQEQYTIINPSTEAIVKRKSITAVLKFFTDFGGMYLQDEVDDKSMTALNAYTQLFANTGKRVHLVDNFYSNTLNYSKNESRLERFHYYNERFKAEFTISGDDVYLYNKVGSYKPDVRIDEDLNIKSATVDIDSENFFTWCKCYYDLEESEGGESENYRKEYVWSDSSLIAQYGEIEGPALYQGNIRNEPTMRDYARDMQRKTVKISHSVNLIDLHRQGYNEFLFHIGDTVRLSLSSINITVDIRIVEINETWHENDLGVWERTDLTLTLGEVSKVQSYKNSRSDAMQTLDDWLSERKTIPPNLLDGAIQRASEIINGDTDSVMEYRKDRLTGHHSRNEGNNVQLNVSGLEFVRNGQPRTAITYEGIIADAITAGIIHTNNVSIMGTNGLLLIDGDTFLMKDFDGKESTIIEPGRAVLSKNVTIMRYDETPYILDGVPQFETPIVTKPNMDEGVSFGRRSYETSNQDFSMFEAGYSSHAGRWANFVVQPGLRWDSTAPSTLMEVSIEVENAPPGVDIPPIVHRQTVYRDTPNESVVINMPLPSPTYGALSFILKFRSMSIHDSNVIMIRTARCWISG